MRLVPIKIVNLIILCCFFLFAYHSFSQRTGGGFAGAYLLREVGPRPIALAGCYTAISNEPSAIFYNPAGLSTCAPVPMFNTSFSLLEHSRNFASLSYAQSFDNFGIGLAINSSRTGNIIARNRLGDEIGRLTDYTLNMILGGSFSTKLASFGLSVKYLNNTLAGGGVSANGFAFDVGSKFNVMNLFTVAVSVQNLGGFLKYNSREDKSNIPYVIRSGLAMEVLLGDPKTAHFRNELGFIDSVIVAPAEYLLFALEANYIQFEKHPSFVFAAEISPHELISLRGGLTLAGDHEGKFKFLALSVWGGGISIKPNLEDFYNLYSIDFSVGNDIISRNKVFYTIGVSLQF
ncbi:MAG: hypothetical protein N2517_05655 [Ignavibacteria bacterium]|nr:hypothetical protein [Ignavibacteria bacterium]